jgi:hypothetical protein
MSACGALSIHRESLCLTLSTIQVSCRCLRNWRLCCVVFPRCSSSGQKWLRCCAVIRATNHLSTSFSAHPLFFHQAHRAVDDCHAVLEILAFELPAVSAPALAVLLEQARKKTMRVWAEQSPFDLKDVLKRRGYRWCDGSDGRPRSWFIDVGEDQLEDEIAFLNTEIYLS